ncbi:hypothetical protein SAY86_019536 [Trapa natans]|uniref:Glutaredoxin domain-containing protein n=1 Tax=Trapa natans TaxID=22666 RepID=A0AAN7LKN1_TRANT|nr:hypothetical protein SAY86_019536 [Trapa natans]
MWRPWSKSTVKIHRPSSHRFSCSSFKDVHLLSGHFSSDEDYPPSSSSPDIRQRSILRRPLSIASHSSILRCASAIPVASLPEAEPSPPPPPLRPPGIIVYYTSLRIVRPTFEACRTVQSILRGFRVRIDERDLSMDPAFLAELQGLFGDAKLTLPRVFIGGRYIGGAEEISHLNEIGELKKLVEGLPKEESAVCDACGGHRFVLCASCNGSHKLHGEKSEFKDCTACNENGLISLLLVSCKLLGVGGIQLASSSFVLLLDEMLLSICKGQGDQGSAHRPTYVAP